MKILVDADGCPVKKIISRVARENRVPVVMIKNINHQVEDDYARIITVDQGRDQADIALINLTCVGDIVVTQDYGVAALALGKKARAIHQDGWLYSADSIDRLLMQRHLQQQARRKHRIYSSLPKRTPRDDQRFEQAFRRLLAQSGGEGEGSSSPERAQPPGP